MNIKNPAYLTRSKLEVISLITLARAGHACLAGLDHESTAVFIENKPYICQFGQWGNISINFSKRRAEISSQFQGRSG